MISFEEFKTLPLLIEGESKEIRSIDNDTVAIWLKPTIYSFTHNRCAWVEGSNLLRARAMKTLIPLLKNANIDHAYREIDATTGLIIADRIDKSNDPNIETIVKIYNSGTSYHRYYGLHNKPSRNTHPLWPKITIDKNEPFIGPKVRFDWRNPFWNPDKVSELRKLNTSLPQYVFEWPDELRKDLMMRDEVMGEDFANDIIDVKEAKRTALKTWITLQNYLARCNIIIYDICLFITSDGKKVFGEINQDCGRFRHLDYGSLDKDVWRTGGSVGNVLEKWELLAKMVENPVHNF